MTTPRKGGDMTGEQWTIQEVVRSSGVTKPDAASLRAGRDTASDGNRRRWGTALRRRMTGAPATHSCVAELGSCQLREIGDVPRRGVDAVEALRAHVEKPESERARLAGRR